MNLIRTWSVAVKEWQEIRRDRLFIALAFIVPVFIMISYGYSLSMDVERIPLGIIDNDGTSMSRQYAEKFTQSRYFDFQGYLTSRRQVETLLTSGQLRAMIEIPEHFQKNLQGGKAVEIQTLIDGSMPTRSQMIKGYVIAINATESQRLAAEYISQTKGISTEQAALLIQPFKLQVRYLYNQSLRSINTVAPTLMMLVLMVIPPFYTTLGVARERESGSIYNVYASTLTRFEFLAGKLFPYVLISILNSAVLLLIVTQVFGAPFKGSLSFLLFATVVYVICTTSIGLMISTLVRTQIAAELITGVVTIFPTFNFSGLLKPVDTMEASGQIVAHMLPAMYYTDILQGTFLKGLGWQHLWSNVAVLAVYSLMLLLISALVFCKRPSR